MPKYKYQVDQKRPHSTEVQIHNKQSKSIKYKYPSINTKVDQKRPLSTCPRTTLHYFKSKVKVPSM